MLGTASSSNFPATYTYGTAAPSKAITFVAKIHLADWSLTWSALIRSANPLVLALDTAGAAYVCGYTETPATFPSTPNSFRGPIDGGPTVFILKLDPTGGKLVYNSLISSYQSYTPAAMTVDSEGQAYLTAVGAQSLASPVTPDAFLNHGGGSYLAKLRADGTGIVFGTLLSTGQTTIARAIALDSKQNVIVAGGDSAYLSTFQPTAGAYQTQHAGNGTDAFVMKFRNDGAAVQFATLLGGSGGDAAAFLRMGSDDSIYVAGSCNLGSNALAASPFPTTADAPVATFTQSQGFVAKFDATGSALLFSTYVSDTSNNGALGLEVTADRVYVPSFSFTTRGFLGLSYSPEVRLASTAILVLDLQGALAAPPVLIPALTADAFTLVSDSFVLASNQSPINAPVPSSLAPLGAPGSFLPGSAATYNQITLSRFLLNALPDHELTVDRGFFPFEYTGDAAPADFTTNLTSSGSPAYFRIFAPTISFPLRFTPFTVSPAEGTTPAATNVRLNLPAADTDSLALLVVSPFATQPIQMLPIAANGIFGQIVASVETVILPAGGGPAQGTIRLDVSARSPFTLEPRDVSVPFRFLQPLPSVLKLDPVQGVAPAAVKVEAQNDLLKLGGTEAEVLTLNFGFQSQTLVLLLTRPGTPPLVSTTPLRINGYLGLPSGSVMLQVTPQDSASFQITSSSDRLRATPASASGAAAVRITADFTRYPVGVTNETLTVQSGSTSTKVTVLVNVTQFQISVSSGASSGIAIPGLRATVFMRGVLGNLPTTGAWVEQSPAPTDWNGYSFLYRKRKLPILSADPDLLIFTVQFPYGLEPENSTHTLALIASDGTVLSQTTLYRELPTYLSLLDDTPINTPDRPVRPGDLIHIAVTGAGSTSPAIPEGQFPSPGNPVTATAVITAAIGGKDARVVSQTLSTSLIGVTDLQIEVPQLAPGKQFLGLSTKDSTLNLIPVWISP